MALLGDGDEVGVANGTGDGNDADKSQMNDDSGGYDRQSGDDEKDDDNNDDDDDDDDDDDEWDNVDFRSEEPNSKRPAKDGPRTLFVQGESVLAADINDDHLVGWGT